MIDKKTAFFLMAFVALTVSHEAVHQAVANAYGIPTTLEFGWTSFLTRVTPEGQMKLNALPVEMKAGLAHDQALNEIIGYMLMWAFPVVFIMRGN